MLNPVQRAAYELIQADARFLYTLTVIQRNAKNISSNYIMMSQPYIGLFTDGAEQWCQKLGLGAPQFTDTEKTYYSALRQSHKLYEMPYSDYLSALLEKFKASDDHFYKIRSLREKLFGYYNVGTDLCNGHFCGNTILCALYTPVDTLNSKEIGPWIRDISVVSGKLAGFFDCQNFLPYNYDDNILVKYEDYHFYKNCPLKTKTDLSFLIRVSSSFIYGIWIHWNRPSNENITQTVPIIKLATSVLTKIPAIPPTRRTIPQETQVIRSFCNSLRLYNFIIPPFPFNLLVPID